MELYEEGWRRYRKRRIWVLVIFVSYLPSIFLIGTLSQWLFKTRTPASVAIAAGWLLFMIMAIRIQLFRCPRCGETFAGTWWYNWSFFASKCQHCGLRKFGQE